MPPRLSKRHVPQGKQLPGELRSALIGNAHSLSGDAEWNSPWASQALTREDSSLPLGPEVPGHLEVLPWQEVWARHASQLSSGRMGGRDTVPGLWVQGPSFLRHRKAYDSNFSLSGKTNSFCV